MNRVGRVNIKRFTERIAYAKEKARGHTSVREILNTLQFLYEHPNQTYYSIVDLLNIAEPDGLENLMDSVLFLSSKPIKIFSLQFCYFPPDSDETIEITAESYFEAKTHGYPPVDTKGRELNDINLKRLGFSCFIHPELREG
ncbi:hypothetical protein R7E47_01915 [Vibrio sp. Vb1026]|uniref:hypothetical protein n=1 Tax=Vibrio sp. Vb1026 TaxID=3074637 RepID=UPI0029642999|nr:hypothetical protein [Vibrio sp. Vb1026]EJN3798999.1 hypothetical protein [Vibrio alginolyticus]MDW1873661.1 hypothetical protein [Vibrio sp. Vb1026]